MSDDEAPVGAVDFRRALALIQHGERGDEVGMRVIIDDEVIPADRLEQLIRATISILWQLVAQLCESDEVAEIGEMLTAASTADEDDLDRENRLVAQMALAQHSGEPSVEYEVLREAARRQPVCSSWRSPPPVSSPRCCLNYAPMTVGSSSTTWRCRLSASRVAVDGNHPVRTTTALPIWRRVSPGERHRPVQRMSMTPLIAGEHVGWGSATCAS